MVRRSATVVTLIALFAAPGVLAVPAAAEDPPAGKAPEASPTVEDILKDLGDREFSVKRLDAANAAKAFQDPRLVPALAKLLKDESPDIRAAAVGALAVRTDPDHRKKAAEALGDRLRGLGDKAEGESERIGIAKGLEKLAQPGTIDVLLDGVSPGMATSEVEARCRAVANVPSPKAIEGLIGVMSKGHRDGSGVRAIAARALQWATGEKPVNDPDHWRAWWKEHAKTFDFEAAADRRAKEEQAREDRETKRRERDGRGGKDGKGRKGDEK